MEFADVPNLIDRRLSFCHCTDETLKANTAVEELYIRLMGLF